MAGLEGTIPSPGSAGEKPGREPPGMALGSSDYGVPGAAPCFPGCQGVKRDGQPFGPGWRIEDALASASAEASLGARWAETQPRGSVGEPRWGRRGDIILPWGLPAPWGARVPEQPLAVASQPAAHPAPRAGAHLPRALLGAGCCLERVRPRGEVCVYECVRVCVHECVGVCVCAQLILLWVKLGEIRNPPRAPEPCCSISPARRGSDVSLSLTSGCWRPTSFPLLLSVLRPCAGGVWRSNCPSRGLKGEGEPKHPSSPRGGTGTAILPASWDAFLSVPFSLTCRWRFLAWGVR